MKFNRAYRRAQVERLRRNRKVYWGNYKSDPASYQEHNDRRLGLLVGTPHPCSGWCCGNPRKWFGQATQQEKRFAAVSIEQD